MQSLFKSRKKRDSHSKNNDDGSSIASHDFEQRSPSGSSAKSTEIPSKSAQHVLGAKDNQFGAGITGVVNGMSTNATNAFSSAANSVQQLPHNVQHQASQQMQNAQEGASKVLNSPFLSTSQQNKQSQQSNTNHQQLQTQPQSEPQGQVQHKNPAHFQQSPQLQSHGPGHRATGSVGSASPGTPLSQAHGFRTHDSSYSSPLSQPSETPWAEYNVQRAAPSPRFGHSANYIAARDGELFVMGGIRDMDILNDLWVIDTNTLTGYQLVTDGYKVGPRVGHASLVLGNAHVVFGGDTKIEESDPLDDNLYLLNTSSLKWTVAQPQGPRPTGRYGHSLSNVGARVYIFGGQVDEEFYDDMWAFDLTNWRSPNAKWEKIQPSTRPPPPRTNHTVVTHKDKLYLFGGANGDLWYSDTWCFDPSTQAWQQLECSGYVPAPCQGHAATIIDDVMYVFGGMSSQGVLIDQLFALKLTTLKWYTFQNLGPGPSPRSGHSLTAFGGDKILVWGGTDQGNSAYVLDVSRINYPEDAAATANSAAGSKNSPLPPTPTHAQSSPGDPHGDSGAPGPSSRSSPPQGTTSSHSDAAMAAAATAAGTAGASAGLGAHSDATNSPSGHTNYSVTSPDVKSVDSSLSHSTGPVTTKEVRELQPHVYAPQSADKSGPTQARSNSAARNSMLFSKRRSVLLPSSPVRERSTLHENSTKEVDEADHSGKLSEKSTEESTDSTASSSGAATAAGAVGANNYNQRDNRKSEHVKSYVTENDGESSDERFVSAVDLPHDASLEGGRPRGHSRGLSFSKPIAQPPVPEVNERTNTLTSGTENDEHFRKLQNELGGMPGGLPDGNAENTTHGNAFHNGHSDERVDSDQRGWKDDNEEPSHKSTTPGLRRSQPRTNLSLNSIDGEDINTSGPGAEAGIIGLSDQMSIRPTDSSSRTVSTASHGADLEHEKTAPSDVGKDLPINKNISKQIESHPVYSVSHSHDLSTSHEQHSPETPTRVVKPFTNTFEPAAPQIHPDSDVQPVPTAPVSREAASGDITSRDAHSGSEVSGSAGLSAELAQLRKQVDSYRQRDLDNEHHQLKMSHSQLQRELASYKDMNGQLTRKQASITSHNNELKQRHDHLEKVVDGHVATLKAQQAALDEAHAKLKHQQEELAQLPSLKSENADLRMKLKNAESAQKHAEEQLAAATNSYSALKSAHSDLSAKHLAATTGGTTSKDANAPADAHSELNSHVNHLVSLWDQFKLPAGVAAGTGAASSTTRGLDGSDSDDSTGFRSLYETQKNAAEQAHAQLEAAYREQSELKNQLRELSAAHSASPSTADLDILKEQHKNALSSIQGKHQDTLKELQQHASMIDDLRARLRKLEAAHTELQSEYQKAVSLSRNQQVALTKTREELNMSRAHAQRLEEQLEDASVQNSSLHADHTAHGADGDISHTSMTSTRNDQAALVIRDLRAQVVILEEEMQSQREQIMRLKKAALSH